MTDNSWKNKIEEMKMPSISIENAREDLSVLMDAYEWFYDAVIEGRSICVYVNEISKDITSIIPVVLYGYQIKVGFSGYLTCAEKYGKGIVSSDFLNKLEEAE